MNRTYRKTIIAGNWKMNKTIQKTSEYARELKKILPKGRWCSVVICPPSLCIPTAVRAFKDTRVSVGAQNMSPYLSGPFTGEISASMLSEAGAEYIIIGHSERRAVGESNLDVNAKVKAALTAGLHPIVCVGETLEQRRQGLANDVISYQVHSALYGLSGAKTKKCTIAYEPIWAIGTGETATPEIAENMCRFIRTVIRISYDAKVSRAVSILYGGSMTPENAHDLLAQPDIDGGLIGGAALNPESFVKIIHAANQPKIAEEPVTEQTDCEEETI